MNRIPLLIPNMPVAERVLPYLKKIDENQWYTNFGPLNTEFERRLLADTAPKLTTGNITTVSNCTVGLELALQAFGLPQGARVLIPAITFVATATAISRVGMVPVIADVDPNSWVLTPELARKALSEAQIDAVMPVSTFGYAHDPAQWDEFSDEYNIPVIIDAAGAYGNQKIGSRIDIVFSFHATKSFGAAEGGAVLSPIVERISKIKQLSNFGIDTSTGLLFDFGTNGKLSEYHCALGLASFDEWEDTKSRRRALASKYLDLLQKTCPGLSYQAKDPDGIYPLMPVSLPIDCDIHHVREYLFERGIETRRWYSPSLSMHPALLKSPIVGTLDVAATLGERIVGLPFFMSLTDNQMHQVCDSLAAAITSAMR